MRTVRDTHVAWLDRVHGTLRRAGVTPARSSVPELVHRGVAAGVYGGLGAGCRAAAAGLGALADRGIGPALEDTARGRLLTSAVDGIIGDRLARERPRLAVPLAVRRDGRDVPVDRAALAGAFPTATGRVAVLLHGLSENEAAFDRQRDRVGTTYAETLVELGWTPVLLRANTGLGLRENGVALAALLRDLVGGVAGRGRPARPGGALDGWPPPACGVRGRARGRPALDHPGRARRHPRHPAPRGTAGAGSGSRRAGPLPAARDGGLRPDPRPALGRRPRPGAGPRRRGAAAAARALPPGVGDPGPAHLGTR